MIENGVIIWNKDVKSGNTDRTEENKTSDETPEWGRAVQSWRFWSKERVEVKGEIQRELECREYPEQGYLRFSISPVFYNLFLWSLETSAQAQTIRYLIQ